MAVRAYLGSLDFNDNRRFGHVDMLMAQRSPGSTLKPFLYGMALDAGLIHSESLLQDVPRHYGDYRPGNFAADFSGPVSASQALLTSLNLPAVQLLEAYGPKRFAGELRAAGVPLRLPGQGEPPGLSGDEGGHDLVQAGGIDGRADDAPVIAGKEDGHPVDQRLAALQFAFLDGGAGFTRDQQHAPAAGAGVSRAGAVSIGEEVGHGVAVLCAGIGPWAQGRKRRAGPEF